MFVKKIALVIVFLLLMTIIWFMGAIAGIDAESSRKLNHPSALKPESVMGFIAITIIIVGTLGIGYAAMLTADDIIYH